MIRTHTSLGCTGVRSRTCLQRPSFGQVTATLEQLIRQEQQRQADLEVFAQLLQQQQQQQQTRGAMERAASNSSSSSALGTSHRIRFSADVDQILLPKNEGEAAIRVSKTLDSPSAGDLEGTVRKGGAAAAAAAAVAAVLGVRWERPKATPDAPYAAQISIDNSSTQFTAEVDAAMQPVQMSFSSFSRQQDPQQDDCKPATDQQQQQQQPPVLSAAADSGAVSSDKTAEGNADGAAQKQKAGQTGVAPPAAAAAPFSPFGNMKDQPWE